MDNILAWLSSTTGVITTFTAFMVAILLFIENSKKLVFKPLSKIADFLFGWIHRKDRARVQSLEDKFVHFMEASDEKDAKLFNAIESVNKRIDTNECDRIRAEIFNYGRIAKMHGCISTEEWRHIQDIYYKYHEVLHGNGAVTEEYNFVKEYYYSQFSEMPEEEQ